MNLKPHFPIAAWLFAWILAVGLPAIGAPNPKAPETYPDLKRGADGYWQVDFNQLASFSFGPPPPEAPEGRLGRGMKPFFAPPPEPLNIPENPGSVEGIPLMVQSLNGQRVRLTGFMLPTRTENGLVKDFLLIRSQLTCCFGVPPAPNEWVVVTIPGKGVPQKMDVPINLYGTLHVGQMFEDHVFSGMYRLDCEKVAVANAPL
jgi:hypothetical protein